MAWKAEIGWTRTDDEGERWELSARHVSKRWEFFIRQSLRRDFFANRAMFASASDTAARKDSSAFSEAVRCSACVTAS